jgi:hypothetical protein
MNVRIPGLTLSLSLSLSQNGPSPVVSLAAAS